MSARDIQISAKPANMTLNEMKYGISPDLLPISKDSTDPGGSCGEGKSRG